MHRGGFNEHNSPTYTRVALVEAERVLKLVQDPSAREAAESLRQIAWQMIANSFHPVLSWRHHRSSEVTSTLCVD
ncbi:hypothetical protein Poly41_08600 [Novipirellula artificiosorum]|uniref:Uncharacterized protein n=2 Tax=Novipirellula artificiosorum TaxID=2528016 RepID=A0A5C6DYP4_9BACT|nr:hypothetical protein Poly41_08600 [Novipirellula artificiosorum]